MANKSTPERPINRFERFFDFECNFIHLNINLGSTEACHRYHDNWMRRYHTLMNQWTQYDVVMWSVRCRQALKLSFSSTYFALSSEKARSENSPASAYYFAYYAMMHAMWAVLYLHPGESIATITEITHSKLANLFHAEFSSGNGRIIGYSAKELAEDLRFLREYYSYRMPLNSPFAKEEFTSTHTHLGGFVKQAIQLASLHSHIINKTATKLQLSSARIPEDRIGDFKDDFFHINGKEHKGRDLRLLDPADEIAQRECIEKGSDLIPFSLAYEHMFDDFMTYECDDRPCEEILNKTRELVYHAIF